ncbi:MAG: ABC transporter ATP-binding protein [Lacunisphaera sp.]|jgi:subfamily B ATP-binding cassette protein MsbA|nr:ABC transporter ATP-binding protein [Lacunisphaera sp.]
MLRRFRPYFRYLRSNRGTLFAAVFYGLLFGATNGLGLPMLIKYVFPVIFDRSGGVGMPMATVVLIAATVPMLFLLRAVTSFLNSYYVQLTGVRILEGVRLDYFRKLQVLPLSFLQRESSGDLLSRGIADSAQLQSTLTLIANDGVKQPMALLGALGFLVWQAFTTDGALTVLVCLAIVPLAVLPVHYVGKKVVHRARQVQDQLGDISSQLNENLAAAREVRAFGLEERETERFGRATNLLIVAQMKVVKYAQALTPAIELISAVGIAATLVFAYYAGVKLETFLAIITALYLCYEPIKKLGYLNSEINRGAASLSRLEYVLDEPVTITDPATPVPVAKLRGHVEFKDLTFAYGNSPALKKVSASIPAGTVCALVGPSGAGKSTFANLVPRFYEAGAGAVTIDGIDVRSMKLADLRRNIALVSQEPVLFNDTIYNNLALGTAATTREEIIAAARLAHAHEFIEQLPQGYDTIVGERGALLSGGQKQRIAIARAFLRHAPILILDEATSALDSDSEAAVQDALRRLVTGKTVLIIAHRFSTIRDASMILVFDRGEIVAQGDHASLYAGNALYKSLYDRQSTAL